MGESLVESPKIENKMGESVTHIPCLQESVSFGRFEHDSLCWERWSTFPSNKYLEEVEKCSTPGSVAQKKAYFEAHYKRIAARKAELLEQEKIREAESVNSEDQTPVSSVCNTSEEDLDVEKSITQNSVERDEVGNFDGEVSDKHIDIPRSSNDIVIQADEVVNLPSEVIENFDENGVVMNLPSEVSENFEENGPVILTSKVSENFEENGVANLTSEVCEIFDESSVIDVIEEVADLTDVVSDHTNELNDGDDMAKEMVKMQPEHIYEPHSGAGMVKESQDIQPVAEDANEDLCPKMEIPELAKPDETVLVKEVIASAQVWHDKEVLAQEKVEEREIKEKEAKKPVKLADPVKTKKTTTLVKKASTNTRNDINKPAPSIPKRSAAPIPKSSMMPTPKSSIISTPKPSKPGLTKTAKSTVRPSVKKENNCTPLTSKKAARPESKRALPTSLHMSLSYGPPNTDSASLPTAKKSLIMERMGDKDIVKRAFKSFQNSSQLSSSSLAKPTAANQPAARTDLKASVPNAPQKKKEGTIRSAKVTSAAIGQQGTKTTLQTPGLKKNIGVDQRNAKAVPTSFGSRVPVSFGSRSQDLGRYQKLVPKKVEQTSTMKDAGITNLQSKSKAQKATEIGKLSQKINPKTKLSSSYNQGHGFLRGSVCKENAKI